MYKGDFPFQCCLWVLQAAAVWLGALNPTIMWFGCLSTPGDGSESGSSVPSDCHTLCSSRGGSHTVDVSAETRVTHVL